MQYELLEKNNFSTINKLFDKYIQIIGVEYDNVLWFTSDGDPYIIKAVNSLKTLY